MRKCSLPTLFKSLFVCMLSLATVAGRAQTEIVIGTGTAGNTGTTYPAPLQDFYEGSRAQYLYLASELNAAGMVAGTISSIKFNVTALNGAGSIDQYTIKIGTTATTSLSATTWESGTNTVFGPVDYQPILGDNVFSFSSGFVWNGTDNIVIEICNGSATSVWTDNASTPWTTGLAFNGSHTYRADGLGNLCNTATTTNTGTQTTRPNIVFTWTPATACTGTPAGGTAQTSASNVCIGQSFTLSTTGSTVASGITYQWQSSADNVSWSNITGATGFSLTTSQAVTRYYRVVLTCNNPGGGIANSSSVLVTSPVAVSGTFTINKGAPTNAGAGTFNNFNDAYNYIKCGIGGPVVFNVLAGSGPYSEQLIMDAISGASGTNTVTFNGNGNTITFLSTTTSERAVIKLNGTDHVRFNNLIITAQGSTTTEFGFGIHLTNDADSNIINGVTINVDQASTSTNYAGIVISGSHTSATTTGSRSDYNLFSNNIINGGYYGITNMGNTGATDILQDNRFTNNIIQNFYLYGFYTYGTNNNLFEGNELRKPSRSVLPFASYGVYVTGPHTNLSVSKNRIHSMFDGDPTSITDFYAIYFTSADGNAGNPNTVSNNLVYDMKGDGTLYGFYNFSSDHVRYYYNTVSFDNTGSNATEITRGFYQTSTVAGVEVKNNIFSITRGGSGTKHVLYFQTPGSGITSNHNDLFIAGGPSNFIGFYTANHTTLADWQVATSQDLASMSVNPNFVNVSADDLRPTAAILNDIGTPIPGITTDIANVVRHATTPDPGAYEFTAPACVAPPAGGTLTSSTVSVCNPTSPISFSVSGATTGSGISYQWQQSTDGGATWTNIPGASSFSYLSSGISVNTQFRRQITCSSQSAFSTVVSVTTNPPSYAPLPYTESFEGNWINGCHVRDIPNNYWRNTPAFGNDSWRRDDDGASGNWTNIGTAMYTPAASDGSRSARFHTWDAPFGSKGKFDLYINANTSSPTKRLTFDFINTTGTDSISVQMSTDGGSTFTRLDSARVGVAWKTKAIVFTSTSATTIIRFEATSDFGFSDIGLDNIKVVNFPPCVGVPVPGTTNSSSALVCAGVPFGLSVTGATDASGLTYQWQISTDGGITWSDIAGATLETYSSSGITVNTSYRRMITCAGNSTFSSQVNVALNAPVYATLPFAESFENTWINGCATRDIPNNSWRNTPITGNESWRRHDDGISANWTGTGGAYTPVASLGNYSARFHSASAISGAPGRFDLYINASTGSAAKRLTYDFINTNGNDSLTILISTNGGATFTRLDSARVAPVWTEKTVLFSTSSATTVIRFEATDRASSTDIGLDNILVINFADCAGIPVAGTATSSSTTVCVEPFTLTLTGSSSAAGISYQWQSSTDNASWVDIPGATSLNYTTTQIGTTYYRAKVTCSFSGETSNSASVQVVSPLPVNGVFTINNAAPTNIPARTFNNFNDAYNHIKCGINGPVVFNVLTGTGPYLEQLTMNPIPGSSATNTVTFRGNRIAAIEFAATDNNERAVIKLRGTKHIIFDSMVVNAYSGVFGYGIQLMSNTDSNTIKNSIINSSVTATTSNFAGIVINGTDAGPISTGNVQSDFNTISNNTIVGGYYGITLAATFAGGANGNNTIIKNDIREFYQEGIYVSGSYLTVIDSNIIHRPTRTTLGDFYGIHFTGQKSTGAIVTKNRIHNPFGGVPTVNNAFYGIHFDNGSDGSPGAENVVTNNVIYNVNGNGIAYGLANVSSDYTWYFHNTVSLDNVSSTTTASTRGFSQTTTAGGIIFFNNLISVTRGGTGTKHGIYLGSSLLTGSDYNNIYVNGAAGTSAFGFYTVDRITINDWRTATGHDISSTSMIPAYVDAPNGNLTPGNAGLDDMGTPLGVLTDILNVSRDPNTPDIGAYEFTPPACALPPVTGTTSLSVTSICENQPVFLTLNIGPYGSGQTFQWQTSVTGAVGTFTNFGTPMLTPDTVILADTTLFYRVAITCGSSIVYTDEVKLNVSAAMPAGTYTINKTQATTYVPGVAGGNFASFNAVKNAMGCGILGPVVFDVVAGTGPYNEQVRFDSIWGATAVNTITFRGHGETIAFASANTTERAVIKLSGADHFIFDSLVINATGGTFGYGVQLLNNADSNVFRNNTIIAQASTTSPDFAGVVVNSTDNNATTTGNSRSDGNQFINNDISGGYYGVTLVGNTTAAGYINNNSFVGNTIRDFYNYGMYVAGTLNTRIEKNTFHRNTIGISPTNVYGVYFTAAVSQGAIVSKNRFRDFFTATPATTSIFNGVYSNSVDAASGTPVIVSNNLFYNIISNGAVFPFYNSSSNNVFYYHNTIAIDNAASTSTVISAGLYQVTFASGLQFKNNIIYLIKGGTGAKYGIYESTTTTELESNNNLFYLTAANSHIGFFTTSRTTLSDWQSASGEDANSVVVNPLFTDPATGNYKPQLLTLDNKGVYVNIDTDIVDASRSTITPDIGAYEFSPAPCVNPPVAGAATVVPSTGVCLETAITLNVTGHSPLGSLTFQWQTSADGVSWTNIGPLQYFPEYNTVSTPSSYFRAAVTCAGVTTYTTPVQVILNSYLPGGTYTINNTAPQTYVPGVSGGNFSSFNNAVDAMSCGIGGPVVFNVAAGTYNEQVRINYIRNSSATNTVLFQGTGATADLVNLTFSSTSTANNYTLKLDSTRHFTFRNMQFTAQSNVFGRAVDIANTASFNNIINNIVDMPVVTSSSNNVTGIYVNTIRGSDIVIRGNTLRNGAVGILLSGVSAVTLANPGHIIDSNFVVNPYNFGVYSQFTEKLPVTRNTVTLNTVMFTNSAGIYANYADSGMKVAFNTVYISNNTSSVYGIQLLNSRSVKTDSSNVFSNRIIASAGNTGTVYGVALNSSRSVNVVNNTVAINSAGLNAYGLYHTGNLDDISYYNNTLNITSASANGYAGYFSNAAGGSFRVNNNIFSNKGGGRALYVNNPGFFQADYNLLYSSGTNLVQVATGTPLNFTDLASWKQAWNWDDNSIVYMPVFANDNDLRPDLANPDVWAMHGRGTQIIGNSFDFENKVRPTTLTAGVPDLGAYEFLPTALPTVLTMFPAIPVANSLQTFMYGTDTVMKITWGPVAPPSVEARRYSGVVPSGLTPGMDSMFFYTDIDIPAGGNYDGYNMQLFYLDPWQGSIPSQYMLGLGKTNQSNQWVVGFSSRANVPKKFIFQNGLSWVDKFTGLVNPYAPPVLPDKDSSNRGRRFWVAYPVNQLNGGGSQEMVLYLSAQEAANVQVKINGTNWVRNYFVPANTVVQTEFLPKAGADNAFLNAAGLFNQGISITSDEPIVAYSHTTGSASSGGSMLLPVGVWGYEYKTLQITQDYGGGSYSYFYVIADNDNTKVEITATVPVQNAGMTPNVPFVVTLNKGQVYQVVASSQTQELSGSVVKSVPNSDGKCFPVATFSGSSRTAIGCPSSGSSGGDFIMQQNFPASAWGKRYLTAPSSASTAANALQANIYRVAVKDAATVVRKNGVIMTGLINNHYYEYTSATADYIESDRPIMVAQYLTGACVGVGDPEMIYISPVEQGINKIGFYRNNRLAITTNYLTLIIPTSGLASMVMVDGVTPVIPDFTYPHPNRTGYTVVVKRWTAAPQQVRVQSDSSFTAITYGLGSVESYGYNAGTLVKSLFGLGTITNTLNTSGTTNEYTCTKAPFQFTGMLPILPTRLTFKLSAVPGLSPNADVVMNNPVPTDSLMINGVKYYKFPVPGTYTFATPGIYPVQIIYEHPDIEACDKTGRDILYVQVVPSPKVDFTVSFSGCVGDAAQLNAASQTPSGIVVNNWNWTLHNGSTTTGQNISLTMNSPGTFTERLHTQTPDGCIGDTTSHDIVVNPRPVVTLVQDYTAVCNGTDFTFNVQSPVAGTVYSWYANATGGTAIATGTSFTATNVTSAQVYYVEAVSAVGCGSISRTKATVTVLPVLGNTTITVTGRTANSVTFSWTAVPGAVSYEVSVNGGAYVPATGTTYTVTGLGTLSSASIQVRAVAANSCQNSISGPVSGCSNSTAVVAPTAADICKGTNATFNVTAPEAGITYTWYSTATGGTALATGTSYMATNVQAAMSLYVEQSSGTCVSATRTQVTVTVKPDLTNPVVTADSIRINSIRFSWNAVPGATGYQVSLDNGVTWISPSGPGLVHIVTGLRPSQEVTLLVRAIGACGNSQGTVTSRSLPDKIFIPNSFSPNGDGLNDRLLAYGYGVQTIQFMVFNQWGEKVFETTSQTTGWDGTYKGKAQPSGVYMYVCKAVLTDGTKIDMKGSINLIR